MRLKGASMADLNTAITTINTRYATTIKANITHSKGNFFFFTLRLESSKAPLHTRTHGGRRINAVCWHGHREIMRELFRARPNAVLVSAYARYDGRDHFEATHWATGERNAGSKMEPKMMMDACDCHRELSCKA